MKNQSRLAAALAVSLLAACSGGGGTPSTPQLPNTTMPVAPQPSPGKPASVKSTAQFAISVPRAASTQSSGRQPKYISPSTGSVRISILSADGAAVKVPDTVAAIAYGATGCTANNSQPLTCTISASAPTGHIVAFTVSTYQSSNGTGAVLSTATVSAPVVAGKLNTIPITLGGVAASIALSPSTLPLFADNQTHIFHFTVNALDASGATIVGATPLASPITLAISGDTNSALQLSTTNVTTPGQPIQLTYRGNVALDIAKMTATSGSFTTSVTLAPLHISPMSLKMMPNGKTLPVTVHEGGYTGQFSATFGDPTLATVAVGATSSGTSTITLTSAANAQGTTTLTISDGTQSVSVPFLVAPVLFNYFTAGLQPYSSVFYMTNGPNGKLWFTDGGVPTQAVGSIDPSTGAITEYSKGLQPSDDPLEIAAGPDGNIYFTDDTSTSILGRLNPSTGAISEFNINGPGGGTTTEAITVGPDKNIWFSDLEPAANQYGLTSQIGVFNVQTQAITLYNSPAYQIESMTTGPDGNIWFTDYFGSAIGVINPATQAVTEYTTGVHRPYTIISAPDGNLWFTDWGSSSIGKIVPSTGVVTEYPVTFAPGSGPNGLAFADGKFWISTNNSHFGSFDPTTSTFTDYTLGFVASPLPGLAVVGSDNAIWYANTNSIGQAIIP